MKLGFIYAHEFGERVIGNLVNYSSFCTSCGPQCERCRLSYGSYAADIEWVYEAPRGLPAIVEDASRYLPSSLPDVDVLIAVGLHPDLLMGLVDLIARSNVEALIVPLEDREWCPPGLRRQVAERLEELGVESAFPKPFCSLSPLGLKRVDAFIERYRVGRPIVEVELEGSIVRRATVVRSAPCGATWYIARQLIGRRVEELDDVVSRAHHSYPCTGSMQVDPELGDTILHRGGYMAREAFRDAVLKAGYKGPLKADDRAVMFEVDGALLEALPWLEDPLGLIERAMWVSRDALVNPSRCRAWIVAGGVKVPLTQGLRGVVARRAELRVELVA